MMGPARLWWRWRHRRDGQMYVPMRFRPLFEGEVMPPPPPTPEMLRHAAQILDAAPEPVREPGSAIEAFTAMQHHGVAEWLRELAMLLPDPYAFVEHFAPSPCVYGVSEIGGNGYMCSLPAGHQGEHEARGPEGEVYARWPA